MMRCGSESGCCSSPAGGILVGALAVVLILINLLRGQDGANRLYTPLFLCANTSPVKRKTLLLLNFRDSNTELPKKAGNMDSDRLALTAKMGGGPLGSRETLGGAYSSGPVRKLMT